MPIPTFFVQIDEEGYALSQEVRIQDLSSGQEILSSLKIHEGGTLLSTFGDTPVIVEAFDEPYVAAQIFFEKDRWFLSLPYELKYEFKLESLSLDEWDRFHGYAENKIPFVMSRAAQAEFFNLLEDFDDDSITADGKTYEIPPYWPARPDLETDAFWSRSYKDDNNPGWNLGEAAESLKDMLPRLKMARSRVLVLGCGEGHDAAYIAQHGHLVTAVDISAGALERAKKLYGHISGITWVQADLFKLPREFDDSFDVVFEHTCYCAINPQRRSELMKVWNRVLHEKGFLMGCFFALEKRKGPPFGGTEWELRQRIKDVYQPVFWGRLRNSVPHRQGKEFFVYAQKKRKV